MKLQSPTRFFEARHLDPTGYGWYGAPRGDREHLGFDVLALPGEEIFACMSGKVSKLGYMYEADLTFRYIEIVGKYGLYDYRLRQCYVKPIVRVNQNIVANQQIGEAQDVSKYHGNNMKNHLHIQLWKNGLLTDPEPLFLKKDILKS